jgi:hypothetical protein
MTAMHITLSRGQLLLDFSLSSELKIANQGNETTFVSTHAQSLIDITVISRCLLQNLDKWQMSPHVTLSDHKQLEKELFLSIPINPNPPKIH